MDREQGKSVKYIDNNATVRNAGDVVRYHTRKVIHRQDVANHTWNVMRIYTERYGMPRAEVYKYMLYHDVAEVITGDIPFQIKRNMPEFKEASVEAELHALYQLGIGPMEITPDEIRKVKICDLIEMHEYAIMEINYGNTLAIDIVDNIETALKQMGETVDYIRK